jgi:hypothetical protein
MRDNNRNQQQQRQTDITEQGRTQQGQQENVSQERLNENPQQGTAWENYRNRSLSDNQQSSERSSSDLQSEE